MRFFVFLIAFIALSAPGHAAPGLKFEVGQNGLGALSFDGQNLLAGGDLKPVNRTPKIEKLGAQVWVPTGKPKVAFDEATKTIKQTFSWGEVACVYGQQNNRLQFRLSAKNTSATDTISSLSLQIAEMKFSATALGQSFDAGMWGNGGKRKPLHLFPRSADPHLSAPVINVVFEGGSLVFASLTPADGAALAISATTGKSQTIPFRVSWRGIAPGQTATANATLEFGSVEADPAALGKEALAAYRELHPFELKWSDRRPIGALFLATPQKHPATNPRGWFNNAKNVDTTTPGGLAKWRARLLKFADDSIKVIKKMDGQGMITWDSEGQQFGGSVFYGDPRLTELLAPETTFSVDEKTKAIDEYFARFRDAGLRTGVCVRPQQIEFLNGKPVQKDASNPAQILIDKIEFARKRWGCTLFYIDSTADDRGALSPDVFQTVARKFPDVLLMPENETGRYFAYSAPLNSLLHHGVSSTPEVARMVYPGAFSVLLASAPHETFVQNHDALVAAVKRGDILVVNAWYFGQLIADTKAIYDAAKK